MFFFYIHADVVYFYAFSNCLSVWLFKFILTKNFACYNFTLSAFKLTIFFIWLLKIRAYSIKVRVSKSQYQGHSIKVTLSSSQYQGKTRRGQWYWYYMDIVPLSKPNINYYKNMWIQIGYIISGQKYKMFDMQMTDDGRQVIKISLSVTREK